MRDAFTVDPQARNLHAEQPYPAGGAMTAVLRPGCGQDRSNLRGNRCKIPTGIVSIANYNCPGQIVITGAATCSR